MPKSKGFSRGHNGGSHFCPLKFWNSYQDLLKWRALLQESGQRLRKQPKKRRAVRLDSPEACPLQVVMNYNCRWLKYVWQTKKQPSMIFPSNIPMIMSYLSQVTRICHWCWDCRGSLRRRCVWSQIDAVKKSYSCTFVRQPLCLQMLQRCAKPCSRTCWLVKSGEVFKGIEIWYADASWGLRPYSLQSRSDCSCKVAAWGSWGTSLWSGEIVKLSLKCCKYKYLWVGIEPPSLNLAKHQVCSSFLAARISHYHELMTNTHFVLSHPHSEGNISLSSCVLQKVPFPLHHSLFQRCIRYLSINQPMVC